MEPSILIPTPDSIPVHWGWFKVFLIITFMIHIILVNIMIGGGIIAFFQSFFKSRFGRKKYCTKNNSDLLEKDMSEKLTFIIAFAVNFGVAPLLFLQVLYGHFIYISSQLMAVYWLSIIGLLIIAYYSAYYYKFNFDTLNNRVCFIGAALLILLFIGFLFTNNMTLMMTPGRWISYFDNPGGTFLNLSEPTLLPRFFHFMTASAAIGGLFIAIIWRLKQKKGVPGAKENIELGMKWFIHATLLQIVVGFWFQMSLPKNIMMLFMGESRLHTMIFLISLVVAVLVLFFSIRRNVWLSAGSVLTLLFLMIIMRDMVRTAYLKPFFELSDLTVFHQYSPLIFFLISLVLGITLIIYMIRLVFRNRKIASSSQF